MNRLFLPVVWFPLLSGCPSGTSSPDVAIGPSKRETIVVTTGMVAELARHVVGERADVVPLMGEGVDPHLFRPTADDIGKLMQADVVFYSGLQLEGAMQTAFQRAEDRGRTVVAVTERLPRELLRFPAEFEGHPDPHVWHDAALWGRCLDQVVTVLSARRSDLAEEFESNAENYRRQLQQLDADVREAISTIPESQRVLVTAHDAFAYFSRTYGIEVRSIQGITTESDPGVQDINQLVDFLVERQIPAIFVEATVNAANVRAVMEGARRRGWTVREGGMLYSDSMGPPGTYEGTYLGMLDHNVTTIVRGLGGMAPDRGLYGKLAPAAVP